MHVFEKKGIFISLFWQYCRKFVLRYLVKCFFSCSVIPGTCVIIGDGNADSEVQKLIEGYIQQTEQLRYNHRPEEIFSLDYMYCRRRYTKDCLHLYLHLNSH